MRANLRAYGLLASGLVALYSAFYTMVALGVVARAPQLLGGAIAFDLVVTAPLVVWALGSRLGHLPARAPFVVAALGFVTARLLLPPAARDGATALRFFFVAGELAVVGALLLGGRAQRQRLLESTVGQLVLAELHTLHMAFLLLRPAPPEDDRTFSMHRTSPYALLVGVFSFLIVVESVLIHIVLMRVSSTAAWLATASSGWLVLVLAGDANALRLFPLRLGTAALAVTVGVRWRIDVPYAAIATAEVVDCATPSPAMLRATSGGAPNLCITTTTPLTARGLFGKERTFTALYLTVDRPADLAAALIQEQKRATSASI